MVRRASGSSKVVLSVVACCAVALACSKPHKEEPSPGAPAQAAPVISSERGELLYVKVTGRTGRALGKPAVVYGNRGSKAIVSFDMRVYLYDTDGAQVRPPHAITKRPVRPIYPGEVREIETDLGEVPAFTTAELVVTRLVFADQTEWRDAAAAPDARPKGG